MKNYTKEDLLKVCSEHIQSWMDNEEKEVSAFEYERSFVEAMQSMQKEIFETTMKANAERASRKKK
jgi:hypothetical protein